MMHIKTCGTKFLHVLTHNYFRTLLGYRHHNIIFNLVLASLNHAFSGRSIISDMLTVKSLIMRHLIYASK